MPKIFVFLVLLFPFFALNTKPAYQLFDATGKATTYAKLLQEAEKVDIVLFGELHNNPICHWLQLELTQDLHKKVKQNLVLGGEMFEADNQLVLDEYLQGIISDKQLKEESKVWNNFATDYKPLINFAQQAKIPFIATNIPRRYASVVSKKGIEFLATLSPEAQKNIAPLPITIDLSLPAYNNMRTMMGGGANAHGANTDNFLKAQAVKDATMAHFILKNWQKGKLFLHYNGSYHSNNFESIVWYLKRQNATLKILTIASVEQQNIDSLEKEHLNKANFILATPENMTKTY